MKKASKFFSQLTKCEEGTKHSWGDARDTEKRAATLAKDKVVALREKEAALKERDSTKAEASGTMEIFKKTVEFAWIAEKHFMAKLIKIYCDLVMHIHEI